MSTWTNITDTVLEPGQPIRSVDIIALKNNILAVPGGAANAPRVQTAAIQDAAVTTAKLATGERMTTANVLAATAGASLGAVGTYANLSVNSSFTFTPGATRAGSGLRYFDNGSGGGNTVSVGTWRLMGGGGSTGGSFASVWLRIS